MEKNIHWVVEYAPLNALVVKTAPSTCYLYRFIVFNSENK